MSVDKVWESLDDNIKETAVMVLESGGVFVLYVPEDSNDTYIRFLFTLEDLDKLFDDLERIAKDSGKIYLWALRKDGYEQDGMRVTSASMLFTGKESDQSKEFRKFLEDALTGKTGLEFEI